MPTYTPDNAPTGLPDPFPGPSNNPARQDPPRDPVQLELWPITRPWPDPATQHGPCSWHAAPRGAGYILVDQHGRIIGEVSCSGWLGGRYTALAGSKGLGQYISVPAARKAVERELGVTAPAD